MSKCITTVGTSLFTNYIKYLEAKGSDRILGFVSNWNETEQKDEKLFKSDQLNFDRQEEGLNKFLEYFSSLDEIKFFRKNPRFKEWQKAQRNCAELATIDKLVSEGARIKKVILLSTHTIGGALATNFIKVILEEDGYDVKTHLVQGLSVYDQINFQEVGFQNLVKYILQVLKYEKRKTVWLNFSGGYKAIIPYLTIVGQLYDNVRLAYIYEEKNNAEEGNELITIDKLPFQFNDQVIEGLAPYLETINDSEFWSNNSSKEDEKARDKLERFGFITKKRKEPYLTYELTPFGNLLKAQLNSVGIQGKSTFGTLIEYMLGERFRNSVFLQEQYVFTHSQNIIHIEDERQKKSGNEIDFVFERIGQSARYDAFYARKLGQELIDTKPIEEAFITLEVKSFNKFLGFPFEQFKNQMELLKGNWNEPLEIWYVCYFVGSNNLFEHRLRNKAKRIQENANKLKEVLNQEYQNKLKIYVFNVPHLLKDYVTLMQQGLKDIDQWLLYNFEEGKFEEQKQQ